MIVAADEQLHEPGADEHWQESYYFNWADREGRSFGLALLDLVLFPLEPVRLDRGAHQGSARLVR